MFPNYDDVKEDGSGIEYIDELYGYAFVLTGNHADAEDLVEKTYLFKLHESCKSSQQIAARSGVFSKDFGAYGFAG